MRTRLPLKARLALKAPLSLQQRVRHRARRLGFDVSRHAASACYGLGERLAIAGDWFFDRAEGFILSRRHAPDAKPEAAGEKGSFAEVRRIVESNSFSDAGSVFTPNATPGQIEAEFAELLREAQEHASGGQSGGQSGGRTKGSSKGGGGRE